MKDGTNVRDDSPAPTPTRIYKKPTPRGTRRYRVHCPTCGFRRVYRRRMLAIRHQKRMPCFYCNRMLGVHRRG